MTALILLDLDGTLYEAGTPIPGAAEAVRSLRAAGHALRFCTNTDSQSTSALCERVRVLGFDVHEGELFTPVVAARRVLAGHTGARTLALVSAAVHEELSSACTMLAYEASEQATHVVVGDFRDGLSYAALDAAFRAVRSGATLLALQTGRYLRAADGPHLDTGAIVAAIEYAAEAEAHVLGKPSPQFLKAAVQSVPGNFVPRDVWVVGDDRTTDIEMAVRAGVRSVQPRTGKHHDQKPRTDLPAPEYVIESVAELPALLIGNAA